MIAKIRKWFALPTKTFLNLPKAKQERILAAAKKEFAEVMFSDVSINRIVKAASISRGSFYMYFTDKHDLLMYLLEDFKNQFADRLKLIGDGAGGDITELMLGLHDHLYAAITTEANRAFLSNYLAYSISASIKDGDHAKTMEASIIKLRTALLQYVDRDSVSNRFSNDLTTIIDAHLIIMKNALANAYLHKTSIAQSHEDFRKQLMILKHGYLRKEEV